MAAEAKLPTDSTGQRAYFPLALQVLVHAVLVFSCGSCVGFGFSTDDGYILGTCCCNGDGSVGQVMILSSSFCSVSLKLFIFAEKQSDVSH